MQKIYMIPRKVLTSFGITTDPFMLFEMDEPTDNMKRAMSICEKSDLVYTLDNFSLCFNLDDPETKSKNYLMYIVNVDQ